MLKELGSQTALRSFAQQYNVFSLSTLLPALAVSLAVSILLLFWVSTS